ncbi:hypothetical protein FSP39_020880 [Pinctada imbricata]|uniref:Intimal thickness related receptor IRP domain-containing protein n=1 Tax=Pinctada imbricata TaxID=66713 RepID=A0AA88YWI0_PINIB|nr:hypothetical protein FSP39_020880 [Pinctada imbricata]
MDEVNSVANCRTIIRHGEDYYQCNNTQKFVSSRDMWWFLVVARCPSDAIDQSIKGVNITYGFHMTNGEEGDILHHEFSADEFYILPIDIAFLIAYTIMFGSSVICAYVLYKKQLFHSTYKMYITSLWIWWFHLLIYTISYGKYSATGYRQTGANIAARVFAAISTMVFMLMLLLMANGYTIVRGRVGNITSVFITVVLTLFALGTGILLILEATQFDEALVLYVYEFWPGYCLIALRIICWVIFTVLLFITVFRHKEKARFYFPLFVWYTLWFWAGPVVILIAMFVMEKWAREKTVHGVEQFVMLCGHIFFLILTRPSAANSNFPYHVKTTQVIITFLCRQN